MRTIISLFIVLTPVFASAQGGTRHVKRTKADKANIEAYASKQAEKGGGNYGVVFDSHPPGQPAVPLGGPAAFLSPGGYLGSGTSSFADFLGYAEADQVISAHTDASGAHVALGYHNPNGVPVTASVVHLVRVGNGDDAVQSLACQKFDVVLMDIQMPKMDGLEATAAIRRQERRIGGHVPIIAMTAHAMKGDREQCLAAGMDGYVSKPIRGEELLAALEKFAAKVPAPAGEQGVSFDISPKGTADAADCII